MSGHVDSLHDLFDSTLRCCEVLRKLIFSFILKPSKALIEEPGRTPRLEASEEGKNQSSLKMTMDTIDISSSDSEIETDVGIDKEPSLLMGSTTSANSRKLPQWASTSGSSSRGFNGPSRNLPLPAIIRTERYRNENGEQQARPSSSVREKTLKRHTPLENIPKLSTANCNVARPANGLGIEYLDGGIDSSHQDMSANNFATVPFEQPMKRALPPSLQPYQSTFRAKDSMGNGSSGLISDRGSTPGQYVGRNLPDRKDHIKDNLDGGNNDDIVMYENSESRRLPLSLTLGKSLHNSLLAGPSGSTYRYGGEPGGIRLLPPSLIHGKSHLTSQSPLSSEPAYGSGVEGRPTENDERLIFQAALQNLSQPKLEATLPDGLLTVSLLKHQKIALAWMFQKETASVHCLGGILADDQGLGKTVSTIALILMQKHLQSRSKSDDLQSVKTEALNLDDDDEGVIEMEKSEHLGESDDVKRVKKVTSTANASHKGRPAAGTLVVCPASVLRQWARELDEKVTDSAKLSVLIYHGGSRTKDPVELAKYDVVLTTYAIVTNEVPKQPLADDDDEDQVDGEMYGLAPDFSINKKRKKKSNACKKGKKGKKGAGSSSFDIDSGALARVGWFRVVLDEAQTIKNHRTQVARACCGLRAKRRWCLSGTPIQNAIDDLYSYFRFLKYDPYSVYHCFTSSIKYPISRNAVTGYKKLQLVLKTIMLRRTKGTLLDGEPIINLPTKSISLTKVDFSVEEREFYSKLEADSRSQFKAYAAAGTLNQNYANILLLLLRLRQACDHPFLVKRYNSDSVGKASLEMAKRLPRDMLINLLNLLEDSTAICGVCSDPPEDAVVTVCGHVFCHQCVSECLTGDDNMCPAHECKEQLSKDVVFSKATIMSAVCDENSDATNSSEVPDKWSVMRDIYCSSKIRAAVEILEKHCKPNPKNEHDYEGTTSAATHSTQPGGPVKAIVFSQWTGMLDLVENSLNHSCIQYRRFDGTMTLSSRDKAVKDFNTDPEVRVMLMSLKAGNLGLNMVAACHVILLDLWWNPTTEDQAIDRAHRIGQIRPVTVSRITIKDTVEDRILALQEEKRKMISSAFGEDQMGGSATRLTVDDLRKLFMV